MGGFAALWTPDTWKSTALTLAPSAGVGKWLGRPFYRYIGPRSDKAVTWVTRGRGWKAPYGTDMVKAAQKLHLIDRTGAYRIPSEVIKVEYKMLKPIAGPRLVRGFEGYTGAVEYYFGKLTFPNP